MRVTLGGERLGSGKKEQIDLNNYGRSTHNLSYLFRTTASFGTVIPFAVEVMLPGDEWDIDLDAKVLTHPTVGPVFGSAKLGLDIFTGDIRLYQGKLHNNLTGIGLNMHNIKLPVYELWPTFMTEEDFNNFNKSPDNISINPSCILNYIGLRGVGVAVEPTAVNSTKRSFNAVPWLMYWDTMKNYYCNKQEKVGKVISNSYTDFVTNVSSIELSGTVIPMLPSTASEIARAGDIFEITCSAGQPLNQIWFQTQFGTINAADLGRATLTGLNWSIEYDQARYGDRFFSAWFYGDNRMIAPGDVTVQQFNLSDIDAMREAILAHAPNPAAFKLNDSAGAPDTALAPWSYILDKETQNPNAYRSKLSSQEGLGLKTYLSDLFNNWLDTDWIDGVGGINDITSIDTSTGEFTLETFILAEKLYDVLNRVVIAGNTYDDYLDAGYTDKRYSRAEIPVYHGGLIKEVVFQEVLSNSESNANNEGVQPLATPGGIGRLGEKHKGGSVTVKANDICYLMGLVHVTPRLDYSQGNRWDTHLTSVGDFRLPGLDEIGFQELITEQMAWWDTFWDDAQEVWVQRSAGKQPAWQNYRTNVNRVFGNFAIEENEMFMVMNRRYGWDQDGNTFRITDLTTYIDPQKFNWIFAQTSLDSQNIWLQIGVNIKARRIMSTRVIPNL